MLSFTEISATNWIERIFRPSVDANDEIDYGNIDSLVYHEGHYKLEGDWDRMHVYRNADPTVTYL